MIKLKNILSEASKQGNEIAKLVDRKGVDGKQIDNFIDSFQLDTSRFLNFAKQIDTIGLQKAILDPASKERLHVVTKLVSKNAKFEVRVKTFAGMTAVSKPLSKKDAEKFKKLLHPKFIKDGVSITVVLR